MRRVDRPPCGLLSAVPDRTMKGARRMDRHASPEPMYDLIVWLRAREEDSQALTLVEYLPNGIAPRVIAMDTKGEVRLLLPKAGCTSVFPFDHPDPEAPENAGFQRYRVTRDDFLRHLARVTVTEVV
jgi:hypothetical protein